jgi:23S rRNA pseudouridine1911/1915/1917 synthase
MDKINVIASDADVGLRLDKFLSNHISDLTRVRLQALITEGSVCKNGVVLQNCSYKVRLGENFTVSVPELVETHILAENIPLDIIYEDEHLLVINKAAGMVVHPAVGAHSGTLVNALLHHCAGSLSGIGGVMRPGIVHRLDKDTSGLIMVAKHDLAHQGLAEQLQSRKLKRTYHAFVWGIMKPLDGLIDAPIARSPYDRKKMAIVQGGKQAITEYHTLQKYYAGGVGVVKSIFASLVECNLQTGRTHQIRVHLSEGNVGSSKCGLIGDTIYGTATSKRLAGLKSHLNDDVYEFLAGFKRQALHATSIRFIHPISGEAMEFSCDYPDDLVALHNHLASS